MARNVNPAPVHFLNDGTPAQNGKLFTFISNTEIEKDTFADVNETPSQVNENPLELDGAGRQPNTFFTGAARQVLEDENGTQIWERDPVESGGSGGSFSEWGSLTIYDENEVVIGSDGNYYRSLGDGNQGNDPVSSPTAWNLVQFLEQWNTNITYDIGDIVFLSGQLYASLTNGNTGNSPATSPANWRAKEPDASGNMTGTTTFVGYGVASVANLAIGRQEITFSNAATSTGSYMVLATQGEASPLVLSTDIMTETVTEIRQINDAGTPTSAFPIRVQRWMIDT